MLPPDGGEVLGMRSGIAPPRDGCCPAKVVDGYVGKFCYINFTHLLMHVFGSAPWYPRLFCNLLPHVFAESVHPKSA